MAIAFLGRQVLAYYWTSIISNHIESNKLKINKLLHWHNQKCIFGFAPKAGGGYSLSFDLVWGSKSLFVAAKERGPGNSSYTHIHSTYVTDMRFSACLTNWFLDIRYQVYLFTEHQCTALTISKILTRACHYWGYVHFYNVIWSLQSRANKTDFVKSPWTLQKLL